LSIISVGVVLVLPLGLRQLLDAAVNQGSRSSLDRLALLLLSLYLLRAGLNFVGPLLLQITGERITLHLRNLVYEHIHSLGLRYFGDQRTGDLISRLTGDVATIRSAITDVFLSALLQVFKLVGSVAVMVALNWRLSLLIFLVTPLATLASRRYGPKLQRMSRDVQDRQADATVIAQEALAGIRLVKAFDRAEYEVDRFRSAFGELFNMIKRVAVTSTALQVVVDLIFMFAIVVIFWYGGTEVLSHRLTAGDFVAFMFYAQNISQGISEIIRLYTSAHRTAGASERVFELLDTKPDVVDAPTAISPKRVEGCIRLEGVSFWYNDGQSVLSDLSFEIKPGEHVAIVGLSGAGKSTLMHLFLRFFDPTRGRILLDGHDLRGLRVGALRQSVSLVSQDVYLFGAPIRENIRYGRLDATENEIMAAGKAAQVEDFVRHFSEGYDTRVGENGVKLSGGQRQRIAIARALLKNAPVLLLDEATSSIDATTESSIRDATDLLQRNRTTITITHRLESVRNTPRIIVLDRGTVVADGPHERLLGMGGVYCELVENARRIGERRDSSVVSEEASASRVLSAF
jgi:subfamily B ATP-binding cassette protein MsbA